MKIKVLLFLGVLWLIAGLAITGCGQSSTTTSTPPSTSTEITTPTTSTLSTTPTTSTLPSTPATPTTSTTPSMTITSTVSTTSTTSTTSSTATSTTTPTSTTVSPTPTGVEATEFMGKQLTPIKDQLNNALLGTQHIARDTYKLTVDGLVNQPLSLSYSDLLAYPQISKLNDLDCVEGWHFTAKWTGPALSDIFATAGVQAAAKIAIFYTVDDPGSGFTSLDLSYINDKNIIIALKLNDITMPDDRGFPFQVVAESKYGYKWAKWVVRIELSDNANFRGYWESYGYNNNADVNGPAGE